MNLPFSESGTYVETANLPFSESGTTVETASGRCISSGTTVETAGSPPGTSISMLTGCFMVHPTGRLHAKLSAAPDLSFWKPPFRGFCAAVQMLLQMYYFACTMQCRRAAP